MNGIEKITARIAADAQAEADEIRAASAQECEELKKAGSQAAQDEYWRIVRQGVKDCEKRVQRLGSTAAMEAKKSVLSLKQEMVSEAFDRASDALAALPENEYVDFLASLADKAARTGLEEIVFNEADKKRVGAKVAKAANARLEKRGLYGKLTVAEQCRDIKGGLLIKEGDIECNCSIETLISLYRSELATQVADVLFA